MTPTRQSLADHFRLLSDEELLDQFRSGDLTELAQDIAAAELRSRNIDPAEAKSPSEAPSPKPAAEPEADANAGWSSEDLVVVARLNSVNASLLQSRLNARGRAGDRRRRFRVAKYPVRCVNRLPNLTVLPHLRMLPRRRRCNIV